MNNMETSLKVNIDGLGVVLSERAIILVNTMTCDCTRAMQDRRDIHI
jgi:hypothetical protein